MSPGTIFAYLRIIITKTMKNIITLILIITVFSVNAQQYYVGAGATYSEDPSFYVSIGTTKKLTDRSGYLGELQYISQKSGITENTTVNGTFAYRFYPISKLSLNAGFNIGVIASNKMDTENQKISKGKMDAVVGLSYVIKRFEIVTRYNHPLDDTFDGLYQTGISYTFSR